MPDEAPLPPQLPPQPLEAFRKTARVRGFAACRLVRHTGVLSATAP